MEPTGANLDSSGSGSTTDPSKGTTEDGDDTGSASGGTTAGEQCGDTDFQASFEAWATARDAAEDSYYYVGRRLEVNDPLPYADCIYLARILVEQGVVVTRTLLDGMPQTDEAECQLGWTETMGELGSHDDTQGLATPPQTLDEVYAQCCEVAYEQSPGDDTWVPSFDTDENGLIQRCSRSITPGSGGQTGPPGWDHQIDIVEISFGRPPE